MEVPILPAIKLAQRIALQIFSMWLGIMKRTNMGFGAKSTDLDTVVQISKQDSMILIHSMTTGLFGVF
jgi:hypothetical protein